MPIEHILLLRLRLHGPISNKMCAQVAWAYMGCQFLLRLHGHIESLFYTQVTLIYVDVILYSSCMDLFCIWEICTQHIALKWNLKVKSQSDLTMKSIGIRKLCQNSIHHLGRFCLPELFWIKSFQLACCFMIASISSRECRLVSSFRQSRNVQHGLPLWAHPCSRFHRTNLFSSNSLWCLAWPANFILLMPILELTLGRSLYNSSFVMCLFQMISRAIWSILV